MKRNFEEITDVEKSFLGCLMQNSKAIYSVINTVNASDFYSERHCKIYSAMLEFASQGTECDAFKLQSYFQERNESFVYERSYLFEIQENSPVIGLDFYANQIKLNSNLRKMHSLLSNSLIAINNTTEDVETILEDIDKNYHMLKNQISEKSYACLSDIIDEKVKKLNSGSVSNGLYTGFSRLDYYITGMKPGQMITLAAPTSMGKTAFALNVAVNTAMQDKSVLFFSLEMEAEDLLDRIICAKARINSKLLDNMQFDTNDVNAITKSLAELRKLNIAIEDTGSLDISKIKTRCQQKKKEKGGLDLIVIDYLQLIQTGNIENRTMAVTNISNKIKQMARDLKTPILCLAQLNRDMFKDKQEPELHHLRDSGSIEQDSDLVWLMFRKKNDEHDSIMFKVAKNRKGQLGKFPIKFTGENYLFEEYDKVDLQGIVQSSLF
jgi:replicative DNA helicase